MPSISSPQYHTEELIAQYDLKAYVETGVDKGVSISYALAYGLSPVMGCDINPDHVSHCKNHEGLTKALILCCDSFTFLRGCLPSCYERTLFFLDAHDPNFWDKTTTFDANKQWPLFEELLLIKSEKPHFERDVIICDDWSSYASHGKNADVPLDFFFDLFHETHDYRVEPFDTGGLILTPKRDDSRL